MREEGSLTRPGAQIFRMGTTAWRRAGGTVASGDAVKAGAEGLALLSFLWV